MSSDAPTPSLHGSTEENSVSDDESSVLEAITDSECSMVEKDISVSECSVLENHSDSEPSVVESKRQPQSLAAQPHSPRHTAAHSLQPSSPPRSPQPGSPT